MCHFVKCHDGGAVDDWSATLPWTEKEFQRFVGGNWEYRFAGDPVGKLDGEAIHLPISE
jgi:hypothetical protein